MNKNDIENISYYYPKLFVHKNYEKTAYRDKYVKIPFFHSKNVIKPNFIFLNEKYQTKNIYIFRNTHHFFNENYDGEIIIEHVPITNDDNRRIFVCAMLKKDASLTYLTTIDQLIENKKEVNVNFNEIFRENILYEKHKNNSVFIFKEPLKIASSFDYFVENVVLFSKYNKNDYEKINKEINNENEEPEIEGFTSKNFSVSKSTDSTSPPTTFECELWNDSAKTDTISLVPIKDKPSNALLTLINFGSFTFIFVIFFLFSNLIYSFFIGKIFTENNTKILGYLLFLMPLILFSLLLMTYGINKKSSSIIISSFYFVFGIILFFVLTNDELKGQTISFVSFFGLIKNAFLNQNKFSNAIVVLFFLILFFIIFLIFYVNDITKKTKKRNTSIAIITTYSFFISVFSSLYLKIFLMKKYPNS